MAKRRTYYAPDNNGVILGAGEKLDIDRGRAETAIRVIRKNALDSDEATLLIDILGLTEYDQA